jgi:rubrerythrin
VAGEAVRFDDLAPEEMIAFLDAARQHSEVDPSSREEYSGFLDLAAVWGCTKCESEHSLEDTFVAAGVPQCPKCGASGWENVVPKPRAT